MIWKQLVSRDEHKRAFQINGERMMESTCITISNTIQVIKANIINLSISIDSLTFIVVICIPDME